MKGPQKEELVFLLHAEMNQFHAVADRQATKVESLTELVLQLSTALQRQTTAITDRMEPRLSLPEKWDGTRGSPEGMLATLAMTFECQPARYPTSCSRVALLTPLLTGRAGEWAVALYNQKSPACNDYETFVKEMKKTFVHPSSETRAMDNYITDTLQKGFIRPSTSPGAAGVFFCKEEWGRSPALYKLSRVK
uniref:DUF4939 domain-containing protein n=1 Tax=Nothobranchius furzeri TaxID=105023 RepID=A0A8C6NMA9_NOTFU